MTYGAPDQPKPYPQLPIDIISDGTKLQLCCCYLPVKTAMMTKHVSHVCASTPTAASVLSRLRAIAVRESVVDQESLMSGDKYGYNDMYTEVVFVLMWAGNFPV